MEIASLVWAVSCMGVTASSGSAGTAKEAAALLCSLSRAPAITGDYHGHSLCLLVNSLYPVRAELEPLLWKELEARWLAELERLATSLRALTFPLETSSYLKVLRESGCYHAGPFYTRRLLSMLGISEAPEHYVEDARGRAGFTGATAIACVAELQVQVAGALLARDGVQIGHRHVFVSESGREPAVLEEAMEPKEPSVGDGVVCPEGIVAASLMHDRSGHGEFLALRFLLAQLADVGVDVAQEPERVTGYLRLYVTHHPCLSCVGALAQVRAMLPALIIEVSYDWHSAAARGRLVVGPHLDSAPGSAG